MQNKKRALYILFKASLNRQTQFSFVYENEQKQSFFLCALNIYFYVPVLQLRQLTPISQKSLIYSSKLLMKIVLFDVCLVQ